MPRAAHVCAEQGCIEVVIGSDRYCQDHLQKRRKLSDAQRPHSAMRGYNSEWRKIRSKHLQREKYCVVCGCQATEVDHITPIREGGTNTDSNLRSMCKKHHSQHTARNGGGFGNQAGKGPKNLYPDPAA